MVTRPIESLSRPVITSAVASGTSGCAAIRSSMLCCAVAGAGPDQLLTPFSSYSRTIRGRSMVSALISTLPPISGRRLRPKETESTAKASPSPVRPPSPTPPAESRAVGRTLIAIGPSIRTSRPVASSRRATNSARTVSDGMKSGSANSAPTIRTTTMPRPIRIFFMARLRVGGLPNHELLQAIAAESWREHHPGAPRCRGA